MKHIAVIGGGASGLMAACFSCGEGREVVLFEKQKKLGRKILVTGNGRCNISNRFIDPVRYHGKNPLFVNNVFARFSPDDTEKFFLLIGIPFREGRDGKLYPASLQASTVVSALEYEVHRRGADVRLHRRIDRIEQKGAKFLLVTAGKEESVFDSVILAAGSCAYSPVGASKIGYALAESLQHRVVRCFPAILPLNIVEKNIRRLQGMKWDCGVSVVHNGAVVAPSVGELLFTGYGLSGPAALEVSRAANELVLRGEVPDITVDFYPEQSEDDLSATLEGLLSDGGKTLAFALSGIMNERLPRVLGEFAGIDMEKKVSQVGRVEKKALVTALKHLTLTPGAPRDFAEAVITAGGVDVSEIDPATMESKKVKNLYITGELLDIDGDSGGFNLQFAWSTGALAGMAQH